tara:strand:- start:1544 stop:2452 length:909 start_codon:yes stop_codon:yes gene_type:complete
MFFQSNGKILLSSEYLVLDGAKSIALPSKKTQELHVTKKTMDSIVWKSYDHNNNLWFEEIFKLKKNKLTYDGEKNIISEKLLKLFNHIHKFKDVSNSLGNQFITKLNFDRNWGLGTSSTFVNNLAKWAEINAYELLYSSFKGSGYDIACCDKNCPITYSNLNNSVSINEIKLNSLFRENVFLIYLGRKQNTQNSIKSYYNKSFNKTKSIQEINKVTDQIIDCQDLYELESLIELHESIISNILSTDPIQKSEFKDYKDGKIKSLGSWGGDFILATTRNNNLSYFKNKGFNTIFPLSDLVYIN